MKFKLKLVTEVIMAAILEIESKVNFILCESINERNIKKKLKTV